MQKVFRILVINPGSTSTKIGVFNNEVCIFEKVIYHQSEELSKFNQIIDQYQFRKTLVLDHLDYEGMNITKLNAVCARGGLVHPIEGGTYLINQPMLEDLSSGYYGNHASNLGAMIAHEIAAGLHIPAYIVDPVVVDELADIARYSGIPDIPRRSIFHALNQKAAARKAADELKRAYDTLNLIVVHMGGGITIGIHAGGKVIDVNNGLHGDGPFSPERAGSVPIGDLVALCFSGEYYMDEIMKKLVGNGGLMAYLNTNDAREVEARIDRGDETAEKVYEAMAYQIAKEIGSISTVCSGHIDAIVLTGGLAYGKSLVDMIAKRVNWIADIIIYPGENELQALTEGALRVLRHEEEPKIYSKEGMNKCE